MTSRSIFSSLPKSKLMRHSARLNLISSGPGSVTVAANVKSVELIFKRLNKYGHMGARKFWQLNLPRVQFHNPELPIQVKRVEVENESDHKKVPAILKVNYADGTSKKVDIKDKHHSDILNDFIDLTRAKDAKQIHIDLSQKSQEDKSN